MFKTAKSGLVKIVTALSLISGGGLVYGCGDEGDTEEEITYCSVDSQCKGDRICVNGFCQNPSNNNNSQTNDSPDIFSPNENCDPDKPDLCDGMDNNCNNLVDELGCGKIYSASSEIGGISTVDLSTGLETLLISFPGIGSAGFPVNPNFSPATNRIVFCASDPALDGVGSVYYADLNNGTVAKVVDFGGAPSWFPDGKKIAYFGFTDPGKMEETAIFTIYSDGSNKKEIATFPKEAEMGPILSPDGQKIAFCGWRLSSEPNFGLYIINSDGSNLVKLVDDYSGRPAWWKSEKIFFYKEDKFYSIGIDNNNLKVEWKSPYSPGGSFFLFFNPDYTKAYLWEGHLPIIWDINLNQTYEAWIPALMKPGVPFAWRF